jgi:hypothetical protein
MTRYCKEHKIQYKDEDYVECPICFEDDYLQHLLDDNSVLKNTCKTLEDRYWTLIKICKIVPEVK